MDKRAGATENPSSTRVGPWVLSTDEDGNLIASNSNGGAVVLAKTPDVEGKDPDAIDTGLPFLKLNRAEPQSLPAFGSAPIVYDAIVTNNGNWGITSVPVQIVTVPENGHYLIIYRICATTNGGGRTKGFVEINGSLVMAQEFYDGNSSYYDSFYMSDVVYLQAGASISTGVYTSVARSFGASGEDPQNATSLTVKCLERA